MVAASLQPPSSHTAATMRRLAQWTAAAPPLRHFSSLTLQASAVQCQSRAGEAAVDAALAHERRSAAVSQALATVDRLDWHSLWRLLSPDALLLAVAVAAAVAVAVVNVQIPALLGALINTIAASRGGGAVLSLATQKAGKQLLIAYSVHAVLTFIYITALGVVGENLAHRLRTSLFSALLRQDMHFFDTHQSGELVSRITSDVQEFKSSFKQIVSTGLRNATQAAGSIVSMYMTSAYLTNVLVGLIAGVIVVGNTFGSQLRKISKRGQKAMSEATGAAGEVLSNMRTVRGFGMEDHEMDNFSRLSRQCSRVYAQLAAGIGIFQAGSGLFINGLIYSVLYLGGNMLMRKEISEGDLMSYLVSAQTIQRALSQTSVLFGQIVRGANAGSRVFEHMATVGVIPISGGATISNVQGHLEFDRVSFAYPSRAEQMVLQDFQVRMPAGKTIALCGLSGAGKSTVAALIERFYDPTAGHVLLDGRSLRELDPRWLRRSVLGYINQEPVLFARSVAENIRYGRPEATDEEVIEAAKQANAHEFINSFPQGYNTIIGERGTTLSGGQKQRIAIARALLKDPRILILDEATSALDAESERLVQDALNKLTQGRTTIIIAHRLSTVRDADVILVLDHGKVLETGSHSQLMSGNTFYKKLVYRQLSGLDGDAKAH